MKKILMLICFSGLNLVVLCQNVSQMEYFIDTDAGFGKNTVMSVPPSPDVSFPFMIDLSTVSPGYHKLYLRTKDDNGIWSLTARRNIEVLVSDSKTTFTKGEYYFDTDPGFGNATPLTISDLTDSIVMQNFTASITGLSEGYHKLYGRLLDNKGQWGFTFRRNIDVYKSSNTSVVKAEYFFDTDQGVGNCASVVLLNPSPDGSFTISISRTQIPTGADTMFVRVQDDLENKWSLTQILNNISAALPLTLLDLSVIKDHKNAAVKWETANEVNVAYFNLQRSGDGINFTNVARLGARNNGLQNSYVFNDDLSSTKAGKVFYRLQMVDNDGRFSFSKIVYVTVDADGLLMSIRPNPAHDYFIISNYINTNGVEANLILRDVSGRTLISKKLSAETEQRINISTLLKGIYTVSITTPQKVVTQKLVVN